MGCPEVPSLHLLFVDEFKLCPFNNSVNTADKFIKHFKGQAIGP